MLENDHYTRTTTHTQHLGSIPHPAAGHRRPRSRGHQVGLWFRPASTLRKKMESFGGENAFSYCSPLLHSFTWKAGPGELRLPRLVKDPNLPGSKFTWRQWNLQRAEDDSFWIREHHSTSFRNACAVWIGYSHRSGPGRFCQRISENSFYIHLCALGRTFYFLSPPAPFHTHL